MSKSKYFKLNDEFIAVINQDGSIRVGNPVNPVFILKKKNMQYTYTVSVIINLATSPVIFQVVLVNTVQFE